jgi:D-alanine-D-alanine ligase
MNVTILCWLESPSGRPDTVVEQVSRALTANGHTTNVCAIHGDLDPVLALRRERPDLIFNLAESFGDDMIGGLMGLTGLLDLLDVPYTGGGPGEIYLQEDKGLSKKLLAWDEVHYPDFASFGPGADLETGGRLRMPLFVKPLRGDSSQGIDDRSIVRTTQELWERVLHIHRSLGDSALAEEYIEGRELYVGVLGNAQPVAFPPIELDFSGLPADSPHVLDSEAKFDRSSDRYKATKSVVAELPEALATRLQRVALTAYRALRVRDYGRIDLRLTDDNQLFVIEVNASCYLDASGEFAMAANAHGLDYVTLVNKIAELAIERFDERRKAHRRRRRNAARGWRPRACVSPARLTGRSCPRASTSRRRAGRRDRGESSGSRRP